MAEDYWLKQTDKPLFPDIEWEKPQTKAQAGKLLIIGGNSHEFDAVARSYQTALECGAGEVRAILPSSVKKVMPVIPPETEFLPSTDTGSFSKEGVSELHGFANWADGALVCGELGRNSQTALLLEDFVAKSPKFITLTKDAVDYTYNMADVVCTRQNLLVVASLSQLQKLVAKKQLITFDMPLAKLVAALHLLTLDKFAGYIITLHHDNFIVAHQGRVVTQHIDTEDKIWQLKTASKAAVYAMQHPQKTLEAITASLH